jgi:peptide/nickel transport system ATP-binding protein
MLGPPAARMTGMSAGAPVASVRRLSAEVATGRGALPLLADVSFDIGSGETVALVGESGSGKSLTSLAIMRLLPPAVRIAGGEILFRGRDGAPVDLAAADERTLRAVRGAGVGMVFQEPMTALNPAFTIGSQIAETIRIHRRASKAQAWDEAGELLAKVGVAEPMRRLGEFPHQLSGGMRQRVVIAIAVACRPALLIADEPTTALDVTTQAQVLGVLRALQAASGMGVLFITHNLALASMIADRVLVMYAGRIVEAGAASSLLQAPRHPYTRALLECLPARHLPRDRIAWAPLPTIEGPLARLAEGAAGCAFAPRCALAAAACHETATPLRPLEGGERLSRCLRAEAV